jgi:predicted amidohydrolase YtcJ
MSYARGVESARRRRQAGPTPWLYGDRLRMVGVKLYADGALGSRGAWLKQPYADKPGSAASPSSRRRRSRMLMSRAAMDGFQVAVHAIGDAANAQVLDAIEELSAPIRATGAGGSSMPRSSIPPTFRASPAGIIASMQPTHQTSDRLMAEARLGIERLKRRLCLADGSRNGVPLAFGSDFPVESPNPFPGLAAADQPPGHERPAAGRLAPRSG